MNRDYVRDSEIDPRELVAITDITEAVEERLENTRVWIDQALNVSASDAMPDPAPERARLKSYDEWLEIREKLDPQLAQDSIHHLPFINAEKASELIECGITMIDEIVDPTALGKSTQRYLRALGNGERTIDHEALSRFLSEISYPVYYFDYETSQSLLPPWDGVRPYQQVPF